MTNTNIETILKGKMNRVEELMNTSATKYDFGLEDGKIQFTGYVGKRGVLAKSACTYVRVFLEASPVKGVTYTPIKTVTDKGGIYNKDAWTIEKGVDLYETLELFQSIVNVGRKLYKESK